MKYLKLYKIFLILFFPLCLVAQYVPDFKVNDDIPGLVFQTNSSLSANEDGYFVVVWESYGSVTTGRPKLIYFQIFDKWATRIGSNVRVNVDDTISIRPSVAVRRDSCFIVTWIYYTDYKMKIFNKNGIAISPEIIINDSTVYSTRGFQARVGVDTSGNIFCSMYYRKNFEDRGHIYVQKFDKAGNKIGANKLVDDDPTNSFKESPDITVRRDDSFIITWRDERFSGSGAGDIFMQMFDTGGNKIGVNMLVNDDGFNRDQNDPTVSSDSSGNFNIVWKDNRLTKIHYQPFCQAYNSNGEKIGVNFRVDQGLSLSKSKPLISKRPDGKYVVGWADSRGTSNTLAPMFRRFEENNAPWGGNYMVSTQELTAKKYIGGIELIGDRVITVWTDERNEPNEGDIYCNILSFQNPDSLINSVQPINYIIPADYKLYQNYPNPFNPSTSIKFEIPEKNKVRLTVYDMLGKEVTVLVNESLSPGAYEYNWNASNLPSGIYYYILRVSSFTTSKTMLLIK